MVITHTETVYAGFKIDVHLLFLYIGGAIDIDKLKIWYAFPVEKLWWAVTMTPFLDIQRI